MAENTNEFGLSQFQTGANGYVTQGFCIGNPNTYCTTASQFAPNCYLIELDPTTNFAMVTWKNTGTTAVPAWTQQTTGGLLGAGSTLTLTANQTGSTVLLDTATGSVVTLPAPVAGLKFTFVIKTTVTSNSHKIITDAGTTFIYGCLALMEASAASAVGCLFNGTSHVACTMNGSTTGGILGTRISLECIDSTHWEISGIVAGSGSLATPAATS